MSSLDRVFPLSQGSSERLPIRPPRIALSETQLAAEAVAELHRPVAWAEQQLGGVKPFSANTWHL